MDHETLFTASKWDILKRLERGPASPLELSKQCATSIANISQQLRLLEMAGLVTSSRIANRDKGKPRVLYRIAGDLGYMIATSDNFVEKKSIPLSVHRKIIMRIWFYDRPKLHYVLEKAFWKIEEHIPSITQLAIDTRKSAPLTLYVAFKGKRAALAPFTITDESGVTHQVIFAQQAPPAAHAYVLYNAEGISLSKREQRGENNEK